MTSGVLADQVAAQDTSQFQGEVRAVLARLHSAIGRFVEAVPDQPKRAVEVQRALDVDKLLAWQIFRVWTATDPMQIVDHVPTPGPFAKVLRAGRGRGVPADVIEEAEAAGAAFEAFAEDHAGDRDALKSMVTGLGPGKTDSTARDRRGAFRASSRLWGVFAHTQVACGILHPTSTPGKCDWALVTGYVGVQQLRAGVRLKLLSRSRLIPDGQLDTSSTPSAQPQPLAAGVNDPPDLIEEFCTRPLPTFVNRAADGGYLETHIHLRGIGRRSAATYFLKRAVKGWNISAEHEHGQTVLVRIPTQVLYVDTLVPVTWTDPSTAAAAVYGNLHEMERGWQRDQADLIPGTTINTHLGHSLDRLRTPDFPRYPEMVRSVLGSMGWESTRFDIYRCRVEFPILHACVWAAAQRKT